MSIHNAAILDAAPHHEIPTASERKVQVTTQRESLLKRKRDNETHSENDQQIFVIRPDASNAYAKPRTFTTICLISRSALPLAYLDPVQEESRVFHASLPILETASPSQHDAHVLIVEATNEKRLYAVERIDSRKYVLCRLGAWVKGDVLVNRSTSTEGVNEPPRKRVTLPKHDAGRSWWSCAAVNDDALAKSHAQALTRESQFVQPYEDHEHDTKSKGSPQPVLSAVLDELQTSDTNPLEELTRQYLDALYSSRTSLAYFSKGPLARARLTFTTNDTNSPCLDDLILFLRGAVLQSSIMDRKFKEQITEFVTEIATLNGEAGTAPKTRGKRKWRAKRDKHGFFVNEKTYIADWWHHEESKDATASNTDLGDTKMKRRIQQLRNRETFLQVILVLEILALEALATETPAIRCEVNQSVETKMSVAEGTEKINETQRKNEKKSNKKLDLSAILDSLLDRLCIWFSLETNSPVKDATAGQSGNKETIDELRDFSVEVIIPFYASRIPEQANRISRKLGGPAVPTATKAKSSRTAPKPGEPSTRNIPRDRNKAPIEKPTRDEASHKHGQHPSLHRSATDPAAFPSLTIKREHTATPEPFSSIPDARARSRSQSQSQHSAPIVPTRKRPSLLQQVSSGRREVDLSAMSQATETKRRKKAEVEAKLQQAISTLKKPNRALAVKDHAKTVDESFAKAIARNRPVASSTHAHHRTADRPALVAVTATPKHPKRAPVGPSTIAQPHLSYSHSPPVPSSTTRPIPSSAVTTVPQSAYVSNKTFTIEATPSRGSTKYLPKPDFAPHPNHIPLESPVAARTSLAPPVFQTPKHPRSALRLLSDPPAPRTLDKTSFPASLRAPAADSLQDRSTPQIEGPQKPASPSIYDSLGWNADGEDDYEMLS